MSEDEITELGAEMSEDVPEVLPTSGMLTSAAPSTSTKITVVNDTGTKLTVINNYGSSDQTDDQIKSEEGLSQSQHGHLSMIQEELRDWYMRTLSTLKPIPWVNFFDVQLDHVYTNLEIVLGLKHKLSKRGRRTVPEPVAAESSQVPSAETEVFKTIGDLAKKLWRSKRSVTFVEGPPGIGKSTLCRRLVHTWAKDNFEICDCSFNIVILLEARVMCGDLQQCILQQLFPRHYKLDEKSIYDLIEENGKDCLIIIDGVDESNKEAKTEIMDLLRGRQLRSAHVFITGRPEVAHDYVGFCDYHLRINGFTKENTLYYINKYFDSDQEETKKKLLQHISLYRNTEELTVNPFTALLLCILAEENAEEISTNQCDILKQITQNVCRRYISNFEEIHGEETSLNENDLLSAAGCLAFSGVSSGKVVFEKSFLLKQFSEGLCNHLLRSGLLNRDFTVSRLRATGYCYFPHKTIQEFLCAQHLAHDVASENFKHCWNSVKNRSDVFMKTCLLNLLGGNTDRFKRVFGDIRDDEWEYLIPNLVDRNSHNAVVDLVTKDNNLFSKLRHHIGRNVALVPLLVEKMALPPVCRFGHPFWFRELDCVKTVGKLNKCRVHVYSDFPEGSDIFLFTREVYRIGENEIVLPVVNCYKYSIALKILRRGVRIRLLNLFLCVLTRGDIVNIRKLLRLLARVQRPMTVFLVLSFHTDNDYRSLQFLQLLTSTDYKNVTLRVHVTRWSPVENQATSHHFKHLVHFSTYPDRFYMDRFCPY